MIPQRQDFVDAVHRMFQEATANGDKSVDVIARILHIQAGGSIGDHRMTICCNVMKQEMKDSDKILYTSPSGLGPTLSIYYKLPREKDKQFLAQATELLTMLFHESMLNIYKEINAKAGFKASNFLKRVQNRGGLKAAKYWLRPDAPPSGILEVLAVRRQPKVDKY
ncbi:hypothetical protein [Spirosoma jeollabukense]